MRALALIITLLGAVGFADATHHYCTTCAMGCNDGPNPDGSGTDTGTDNYFSGTQIQWKRTWFPHDECRDFSLLGCDDHGTAKCYTYEQRIKPVVGDWGTWKSETISTNVC